MDAQQFLAEFGHIANAPGGVARLRELVLQLAVSGRLVEQLAGDTDVAGSLVELGHRRQKLLEGRGLFATRKHKNLEKPEAWFSVPQSWRWESLGYISLWPLKDGDWIESKDQDLKGDVRIIQLADVGVGSYRDRSNRFLTSTKATDLGCYFLERNDVLIARLPDPLGRACIFPGDIKPSVTVVDVAVCRCDPEIVDPRFLMNCLNSPAVSRLIKSWAVGTTRQRVATGRLGALPLPIAPIEEQSRIVAKVEELMALCDKLEAQQQARRKLQNNLRQSTLQAVASATSPHELQTTWARLADNFGRLFDVPEDVVDLEQCIKHLALKGLLTEQERSQQVSADVTELANASVAAVLDAEMDWAVPGNWVWARCAWLGEARLGKMLDAAKNKGEFRPYLRNVNVRWGKFDLSDILSMRVEEHELPRVTVRKGDLIICEGGEPGRAAIWDKDEEFVIQKALHRFRCNTAVLPEYLLFCLEHDFFSGRLARYYTGATIKHLTGRALSEYPIPLPPVEEQERILAAAKKLASCTANLKGKLGAGIRCAEALAEASIASLTGITLEQEKEVPVKAPQTELIVPLRLGTAPDIKVQAPLATILARHHGEMSAKNLWQRFGGEIDAFYAQLKTEVAHGWILEPAPAEVREKPADMVSA